MIVVMVKLWVGLVVDVIFDFWLFMVMNMGHDWLVMLVMVSILVVQVVVVIVWVVTIFMINIVMNWLMDNFMVNFMNKWYVVWLVMMRSRMGVFLVVLFAVNWAVVNFVSFSMVWILMVDTLNMCWLNVMLM